LEECDLVSSIDRGLDPFGSYTKAAIYQGTFAMEGHLVGTVLTNPRKFVQVIEELFGESAINIEKSIVREIRNTFSLSFEDARSLTRAINAAKKKIVFMD
jgi:hypothetical protein